MLPRRAGLCDPAKDRRSCLNIFERCRVDSSIRGQGDYRSRMGIPALPFSRREAKVRKPLGDKYVEHPKTIGDQLRNKRLELQLSQNDVAKIIGVSEDSITYWENNRSKPFIRYYPGIIKFLGYCPIEVDIHTLAGKLILYRHLHGLTQKRVAKIVRLDQSTIQRIESNNTSLKLNTGKKLKVLLKIVS